MKRLLVLPVFVVLLAACAGTPSTTDAAICSAARTAWHSANSLDASVDQTKADQDAVVSMSEGAPNLKYKATLDAASRLWSDSHNSPALVVPDIGALNNACSGIPSS